MATRSAVLSPAGLKYLKSTPLASRESLAGLVGGLVEGLVGDIAVVGDHGDLVRDASVTSVSLSVS